MTLMRLRALISGVLLAVALTACSAAEPGPCDGLTGVAETHCLIGDDLG